MSSDINKRLKKLRRLNDDEKMNWELLEGYSFKQENKKLDEFLINSIEENYKILNERKSIEIEDSYVYEIDNSYIYLININKNYDIYIQEDINRELYIIEIDDIRIRELINKFIIKNISQSSQDTEKVLNKIENLYSQIYGEE